MTATGVSIRMAAIERLASEAMRNLEAFSATAQIRFDAENYAMGVDDPAANTATDGVPVPILTRAEIERAMDLAAEGTFWGTGIAELMGPDGIEQFRREHNVKIQKREASQNAWQLLKKTIGDRLYAEFEKQGYFEVQGKRGRYRFHKDKQGGVTFIETRKYGEREVSVTFDLCIQSQAPDLPAGDVIASRYLTWKADEEAFLQTANFRKADCADEAHTRNVNNVPGGFHPGRIFRRPMI